MSTELRVGFGPAHLPLVLSYDEAMNADHEDLWRICRNICGQHRLLFEMHSMQSARAAAAEAHFTLLRHQLLTLDEKRRPAHAHRGRHQDKCIYPLSNILQG